MPIPFALPLRQMARGVAKRFAFVGVAGFVLMLLAGPAAAEDYVVQPGDSLSTIARDNGIGLVDLAAANDISNLHLIRVGQVLALPVEVYRVQPGDALSVIAKKYGVATSAIAEANAIGNVNVLRVGADLRIPSQGTAPAAAVTNTAVANSAGSYSRLPSRLLASPERLDRIPSFEKWAEHYGIAPDLLMAVAYRESGWQTSVVSPKGAVGVGQLMPRTSEWVARSLIGTDLDPYNPDDNIRMSARFLLWLKGYMGSEEAAIAAYYQGPGSVRSRGYYDDTEEYVDNIAKIRSLFNKG